MKWRRELIDNVLAGSVFIQPQPATFSSTSTITVPFKISPTINRSHLNNMSSNKMNKSEEINAIKGLKELIICTYLFYRHNTMTSLTAITYYQVKPKRSSFNMLDTLTM